MSFAGPVGSLPVPSFIAKRLFSQGPPRTKSLNIDNINPHVKEAKYAVRGELAIRSEEFKAALSGVSRLSSNIAAKNERIGQLLTNLQRVSTVLNDRDEDIVDLMKQSDSLFQALVARRDAVHALLVSTSSLSKELSALVRQSRADLEPALTQLDDVVGILNKNEENIDNGLRLMAPFYRVFANTLGNGPWFDTYIQNLPPAPDLANGGGVG